MIDKRELLIVHDGFGITKCAVCAEDGRTFLSVMVDKGYRGAYRARICFACLEEMARVVKVGDCEEQT